MGKGVFPSPGLGDCNQDAVAHEEIFDGGLHNPWLRRGSQNLGNSPERPSAHPTQDTQGITAMRDM